MATKLRSVRSDCCSCRYSEIGAMRCLKAVHGDARSAEWATILTWGCSECCSAGFPACCRSRDASKSDDSPSTRTPDVPRSRTRTESYYHTNKICRPRKI